MAGAPTGQHGTSLGRRYLLGAALALGCALLWAASYASLSWVRSSLSVPELNAWLFLFASLFLYAASALERGLRSSKSPSLTSYWRSGLLPLLVLANLGNFLLSVGALGYLSASDAMPLASLAPLVLASFLVLTGRKHATLGVVVPVLLGALGVFALGFGRAPEGVSKNPGLGSALALLASISFAAWIFLLSQLERGGIENATRTRLLADIFAASALVTGAAAWLDGSDFPEAELLVVLALNGLRVAAVYYVFQLAIRCAGSLVPSVVVLLQVPLTLPFDSLWNRVSIGPGWYLGSLLIVAAAGLSLREQARTEVGPELRAMRRTASGR